MIFSLCLNNITFHNIVIAPHALSLACSQFLFSVSLDPFAAAAAATTISSSCEENLQSKLLLIVSKALGIVEQEQGLSSKGPRHRQPCMYSPRLCLSCFERLRKRESQVIRSVVSLSSGVQQIGFVVLVVVVFSFFFFFLLFS